MKKLLKSAVSLIVILFPTMYFGVAGKTVEMGLAVVAGCLACVFVNIREFSEFKGAGFEAKLRDTVEEAQITIKQMKNLMKPIIIFSYHEIIHSGRLGSGYDKKEELFEALSNTIKSLHMDFDKEINEKQVEYRRYNTWDRYRAFIYALPHDTAGAKQALDAIGNDYDSMIFPSKEKITSTFQDFGQSLRDEDEIRLNEYLRYKSLYLD